MKAKASRSSLPTSSASSSVPRNSSIGWVYNDACAPSPGCVVTQNPPPPSKSGISYAQIWQFVRSPRDKETAVHCTGYSENGHCYAPGDTAHSWFLDVNTATSSDPSGGAK